MNSEKKANRLINEKSPYLLQHAYNPVDWFPWGEEAFEKAKKEDKPVLVSIGYSTCHWCHVMAHESFEDEEIAKVLNEKYIAIKVDREERPDVDSVYMRVCQMMTGHGGWPLNVFLTPDQKPFYAGTYFPKTSKYEIPSFLDVIQYLSQTFNNDRTHVEKIASNAANSLQIEANDDNKSLNKDIIHLTFQQLYKNFDKTYGGFGTAPKFPMPHTLMFLLRYHALTGNENALNCVSKTLNGMADGGIHDQIGNGFSRYSTDEKWLVPHFEKMLYDNALLLIVYTEAYQVTKNSSYKRIATKIIEFIEREMTGDEGVFFSAIDADSEGVEGKYYVWDNEEIYDILGEELGDIFADTYGFTPFGNFEGKNIPNLIGVDLEPIADEHNLSVEQLQNELEKASEQLLKAREKRVYPHVDDKVLTSWNALMIAGLSKASKVFNEPKFLQMAQNALSFIEQHLIIDGRVMVRYRDGEVKNKGFIDDYAFLLWAYVELYEATYNLEYMHKAKELSNQLLDLFWDDEYGGFYLTANDAEELIVREKEVYDGALPSGNSVAAMQLLRLGQLTGDLSLIDKVTELHSTFKTNIESYPSGHTFILQSLLAHTMPKKEIVIIGKKDEQERTKIIKALQQSFNPNYSILVAETPEEFKGIVDFASDYKIIDGKTTVYVCENFSCQQPTTDTDQVIKQLL